MCTTCGCGHSGPHMHEHVDADGNVTLTVHDHDHDHEHDHGHTHDHEHAHAHPHDHSHGHDHPAHSHDADMSAGRAISIEEDILARNDAVAAKNRALFAKLGALALNLVSSPGSGKTELLCATLKALSDVPTMVIEGDQETDNDADRIRATGTRALQINTGKGCHLDAAMIERALDALKKIDLLPYVLFDAERAAANVLRVNPRAKVLQLSATTGEGLEKWLAWVKAQLVLASL